MKRPVLMLSVYMLASPWFLAEPILCQSRNQAESPMTIANLSKSIADLAQRVRPSVVQIRTVGYGIVEGQEVGWVSAQRTGSGPPAHLEAGFA